jgi:hypothetical protein
VNLALNAQSKGLAVHEMLGFDYQRIRGRIWKFQMTLMAVIAIEKR